MPIIFNFLLSQPRKTQPNIEQTQHINFTSKISSQYRLEEKNWTDIYISEKNPHDILEVTLLMVKPKQWVEVSIQ